MAIVEAMFVYNTATRADKLPRKELPEPTPATPPAAARPASAK
jgi:hypothetical protein